MLKLMIVVYYSKLKVGKFAICHGEVMGGSWKITKIHPWLPRRSRQKNVNMLQDCTLFIKNIVILRLICKKANIKDPGAPEAPVGVWFFDPKIRPWLPRRSAFFFKIHPGTPRRSCQILAFWTYFFRRNAAILQNAKILPPLTMYLLLLYSPARR